MKVVHWTMFNRSGMNRVAETLCEAEKALGLDSYLANPQNSDISTFDHLLDADVHVSHTHFPDEFAKKITKPYKLVWVAHGTPENVFMQSVENGTWQKHGCGDGLMLHQHWLSVADACVTFWPRHQAIWQSMAGKHQKVHCIPLGVDKTFWKPMTSRGHFAGNPAIGTWENCHTIKWPYDLIIAWPWVYPKLSPSPSLHVLYLPNDVHRWFFPLANSNGAAYASHMSSIVYDHENLRNAYNSIDFYIGLVRYGDFNRVSLEANACGCKTVSYAGNPHSDYWVTEGDQRILADQLIDIFSGKAIPRQKTPVPDAAETATAMKSIYESL